MKASSLTHRTSCKSAIIASSCHSRESRNTELVPDFRRDDVWTPASAPG